VSKTLKLFGAIYLGGVALFIAKAVSLQSEGTPVNTSVLFQAFAWPIVLPALLLSKN
jgi:hypothetical protein